ncbi:MAG: sensor histidine kinase [Chitinophagaceae bacterium]
MDKPVIYILITGTIILILLAFFIVGFIVEYRRRRKMFLAEKNEMQNKFEQEQLRSRLEIQEQTFNHISQEIHDNIGQILSLVRLQINTLGEHVPEDKISITDDLLEKAIKDLRNLSHSLSTDRIKELGIPEFIKQSLIPFEKSGNYKIVFAADSENFMVNNESALIIYRIVQEVLNNIVKHAKATEICINLKSTQNKNHIIIRDNGKGFEKSIINTSEGIGLKNIMARAKLIGATLNVSSAQGCGTTIEIII